jgi:DNA (cytosine-5)-methyltransferase 1
VANPKLVWGILGWAKKLRGIDVFSGAGGMSVGAAWAGVKTVIAVENDHHAARTYAQNHKYTQVLEEDIRKIDFTQFKSNELTVLFGGPPCQGFSTSNQRTRNSENKTNWLFKEFLRAAEELDPEWIVFENVRGIAETEGAKFLGYVVDGLKALGYSVWSSILNARDFGVPQNRSRLFVVASRTTSSFGLATV